MIIVPQAEIQPQIYEPWNRWDCLDVVTTVAISVLLATAASLAAYFIFHSGAQAVAITSKFSISLPLLITSTSGIVLTITLLIQIVRGKRVTQAFLKVLRYPIRYSFHSGGRTRGVTADQYRETHGYRLDEVTFSTRDNVQLRGIWRHHDNENSTVILFHGREGRAERIVDNFGKYYFDEKQFNILCVEYRGYGISEGTAAGPNQEMEAYLDAEAALDFILKKNISKERIIAHGFSMGGVYAAALGYFFDIQKVVLDHTFTSAEDVATHFMYIFPRCLVKMALRTAYAYGRLPPLDFGIRPLQTDGFNIRDKVANMKGKIFVIQGQRDWLMSRHFAQELVEANHSDQTTHDQYLVTLPGGHSSDIIPFFNGQYPEQLEALSNFLCL